MMDVPPPSLATSDAWPRSHMAGDLDGTHGRASEDVFNVNRHPEGIEGRLRAGVSGPQAGPSTTTHTTHEQTLYSLLRGELARLDLTGKIKVISSSDSFIDGSGPVLPTPHRIGGFSHVYRGHDLRNEPPPVCVAIKRIRLRHKAVNREKAAKARRFKKKWLI